MYVKHFINDLLIYIFCTFSHKLKLSVGIIGCEEGSWDAKEMKEGGSVWKKTICFDCSWADWEEIWGGGVGNILL